MKNISVVARSRAIFTVILRSPLERSLRLFGRRIFYAIEGLSFFIARGFSRPRKIISQARECSSGVCGTVYSPILLARKHLGERVMFR